MPSLPLIDQDVPDHAATPCDWPGRIEHLRARDSALHAWACLADPAALRAAPPSHGPLSGVCFGVKDVIDVAGMPTRSGSRASDPQPRQFDAACVAQLREAGAVAVGKTVTAEYAYAHPGPTRNPHHAGHTPGGSSSGSAAAVAAGMVPIALGTQTGGSMIRPAAYCGVIGFKPTFGRVHRHGMDVLCDSLDTIGWFGATVGHVRRVAQVLLGAGQGGIPGQGCRAPRVLLLPAGGVSRISPAASHALRQCARELREHGATVTTLEEDGMLQRMLAVHACIMTAELARAMLPVARAHEAVLSPVLRKAIQDGLAIGYAEYTRAQHERDALVQGWRERMSTADFILTPSCPGEAPAGLSTTGTSVMNRPWSLLGWPCLHLPTGRGAGGLPVGVQWVGRSDEDAALLAWAEALHGVVVGRDHVF